MFLKKIAFVRDYEIRDGVAFPSHIQSTVDTRIVGRAELEINFSNFSREDSADDEAAADVSSESDSPAVSRAARTSGRNQSAPSKKSMPPGTANGARIIRRSASFAEENAVSESAFV